MPITKSEIIKGTFEELVEYFSSYVHPSDINSKFPSYDGECGEMTITIKTQLTNIQNFRPTETGQIFGEVFYLRCCKIDPVTKECAIMIESAYIKMTPEKSITVQTTV